MSRLIDADALKPVFVHGRWDARYIAEQDILNAATIDAVPVVRCKNCEYGEIEDPDFPDQYFCHAHGCDWNEGDHFCSSGKEKVKEKSDVISINNGCIEMTLNSPITEEQLDAITDVDFERTKSISFHTKHGKDVEFAKVVRCKDCKHWKKEDWNIYVCHHGNHADVNTETYGDWFCADGEKVTES